MAIYCSIGCKMKYEPVVRRCVILGLFENWSSCRNIYHRNIGSLAWEEERQRNDSSVGLRLYILKSEINSYSIWTKFIVLVRWKITRCFARISFSGRIWRGISKKNLRFSFGCRMVYSRMCIGENWKKWNEKCGALQNRRGSVRMRRWSVTAIYEVWMQWPQKYFFYFIFEKRLKFYRNTYGM